MMRLVSLGVILCGLLLGAPAVSAAPDDSAALAGIERGRAVFDLRVSEPGQLLFALKVIEETEAGLRRQGVAPDFVLTFRGRSVERLVRSPASASEAETALLAEVRERLAQFRARGMVLEACNVAVRTFKVEPASLVGEVQLVGNSIISLIGYQSRGYALVPMY